MAEFRLIATDLDGTLVGGRNDIRFFATLREEMTRLRRDRQVLWAVCTGRSLRNFRQVFEPFDMMDVRPDFVITEHAYIWSVRGATFIPHRLWNWRIRYLAWRDRKRCAKAIRRWHQVIRRLYRPARTLHRERGRLCMGLNSDEDAVAVVALLRKQENAFRHLKVFRYQSEVDVRTIPFTKGLAVAELARRIGASPEHILCIGDGHNDISMLAPDVARLVGCPLNAVPEIMDEVRRRGGHVARTPSLEGVLEIVKAFETDAVNSEVPPGWQSPCDGPNPVRKRAKSRRRKGAKRRIAVAVVAVYLVLAAFAGSGALPFSNVIMLPLNSAVNLIVWLMKLAVR